MTGSCPSCFGQLKNDVNFCPHCGFSENKQIAYSYNLAMNSELKGRYTIGKTLSMGSFSITYAAWDKETSKKVAIKEYLPIEFANRSTRSESVAVFKDDKKQKQYHDGLVKFVEESGSLCELSKSSGDNSGVNSGIVKTLDSFIANETAYMVMEFLDGETLYQYLDNHPDKLSFDAAANLLAPIVKSLQLAHSEGIIHGDVSLKNIIITKSGQAKLINFAGARYSTATHSRSLLTLVERGYSPEEQYGSGGDQGVHTDVYALGAVFYRLIMGFNPPDALERRHSLETHRKDIIRPIRGITQANAIMNALNVRSEDRTPNLATFEEELFSGKSVKRKRNKIKWINFKLLSKKAKAAVVACATLILAAAVFSVYYFTRPGVVIDPVPEGFTRVPLVENQPIDNAAKSLEEKLLLYTIAGKVYSHNIEKDFVLLQDIAAGEIVEINKMVMLTISGGPEMKVVPWLVGKSAEDAAAALEALGFVVKQEARYSQVLKAGLVIGASNETDDELAVGSVIVIYISQGPNVKLGAFMAVVPDFIGLSWQEVEALAENTGFIIDEIEEQYSNDVPAGYIISQNIPAGEERMTDVGLVLVLSLGEHVSRVPDVQYKTVEEAISMLEAEGLKYAITEEESLTVSEGLVSSQDIAADTTVEYGSTVALIVSTGPPSDIPVPDVVGKKEQEAQGAITALGLTVSVSYEYSQMAQGVVLSQDVAPGTLVSRGKSVTITVSSGENLVSVPSVTGKDRAEAEREIGNAGFVASINEVFSETEKERIVISQSPSGGSMQAIGTTVIITASKGAEPRDVPNVVNLQQTDAESKLRGLGLVANSEGEFHNTVKEGLVISQTPTAGSKLAKGGTVNLKISLGPKEGKVKDVTGLSRANAEQTLKELGFIVSVEEEYCAAKSDGNPTTPKGNVIRQSPMAGTVLVEGSKVTLTISLGLEPIKVPNVVGKNESDATKALRDAGLKETVRTEESSTVAEGYVISQSPSAGADADKGGAVTITVSIGYYVNVPNVVGFTRANAVKSLENSGFKVSEYYEESATVAEGSVISHSPTAGKREKTGTVVSIIISEGKYVSVPDVRSLSQSEARRQLENLGLVIYERGTEESSSVPAGYIISQSPSYGSRVTVGSRVDVIISEGTPMLYVPDVVGKSRSSAESTLRNYDFRVVTDIVADESENVVLRQSPSGGTSVAKGSTVTIEVGDGTVYLPNVVGSSQSDAENTLRGSGFYVDSRNGDESDNPGIVTAQSPSGGGSSRAKKGATITITVSIPKTTPEPTPTDTTPTDPPTTDPPPTVDIEASVWNAPYASVSTGLTSNFAVSVSRAESDDVEEGYIISMSATVDGSLTSVPRGSGVSADKGGALIIVVSNGSGASEEEPLK